MYYTESPKATQPLREQYRDGLNGLIAGRQQWARAQRDAFCTPQRLREDPAGFKMAYCNLLGWPLNTFRHDYHPQTQLLFDTQDADARIRRVRIPVLDGYSITGLLLTPHGVEAPPVVFYLHGGCGTPELCCDIHGPNYYRALPRRILRKGAAVFAPQLLLWQDGKNGRRVVPEYGPDYSRSQADGALRQLGGSVTAAEIFALKRAADWLEGVPEVDGGRMGIAGVSYGGYYALSAAALEPRFRSVLSECWFNDRTRYPWADVSLQGAAEQFLDAEIAALICPRALFITAGRRDPRFDVQGAQQEFARLEPFYQAQNARHRLGFRITEGGHAPDESDEGLDFLLAHL